MRLGNGLYLGKKPARKNAIKLKFGDFIDREKLRAQLPQHPAGPFGHERLIREQDWQMLGNDSCGNCVFAGAAHETKLILGEAGQHVWFSTKNVLKDYSAVTGYIPGNDATDTGTDMQTAAKYRQDTGIHDGHGKPHKIIAYAEIEPRNMEDHLIALWVLGLVGVGVEVPDYMGDQFDENVPFDVVPGRHKTVGGHYMNLVARRTGLVHVTWGRLHPMTEAFLDTFNDESVAYVTEEGVKNGKNIDGFDVNGMLAAANALRR
jgi:hypothetical protein